MRTAAAARGGWCVYRSSTSFVPPLIIVVAAVAVSHGCVGIRLLGCWLHAIVVGLAPLLWIWAHFRARAGRGLRAAGVGRSTVEPSTPRWNSLMTRPR